LVLSVAFLDGASTVTLLLQARLQLQVVLVAEEHLLHTTCTARSLEVAPITPASALELLTAFQPGITLEQAQQLLEGCGQSLQVLQVLCGVLRQRYLTSPAEFLTLLADPQLPGAQQAAPPLPSGRTGEGLRAQVCRHKMHRALLALYVALPEQLVGAMLVLAQVPAPFTREQAAPLLALAGSPAQKHSLLRRLASLGLLQYSPDTQMYSLHKIMREAALLLSNHMGHPYSEVRRQYALVVLAQAARSVLPQKSYQLAANLAWQRVQIHIVQLVGWAMSGITEELLPVYVVLVWDWMARLQTVCSASLLQGELLPSEQCCCRPCAYDTLPNVLCDDAMRLVTCMCATCMLDAMLSQTWDCQAS
jgi:hypothetical protein